MMQLPPLSAEEYEALEADILANGVRHPVELATDGDVLDGVHRQRICDEHGLECPTVVIDDVTTDAEKSAYRYRVNFIRRNLSPDQKVEADVGRRGVALALNQEGYTQEETALLLGVSRSTVETWLQNISIDNGVNANIADHRVALGPGDHAAIIKRRARKTRGDSQSQIAADLGVSQSRVAQLEAEVCDLADAIEEAGDPAYAEAMRTGEWEGGVPAAKKRLKALLIPPKSEDNTRFGPDVATIVGSLKTWIGRVDDFRVKLDAGIFSPEAARFVSSQRVRPLIERLEEFEEELNDAGQQIDN